VARAGVEPATFRFSGGRSYQLSYLAAASVETADAGRNLTAAAAADPNRIGDARETWRQGKRRLRG
jgi:hypothetical protein